MNRGSDGDVLSPLLSSTDREAVRIEIICTGDEVLTGKIVNTKFSTISQSSRMSIVNLLGHDRRR